MRRVQDVVFFLYFVTHMMISILVDFQSVMPFKYPSKLVELKEWYCREYRDPMMLSPPEWFRSFSVCELIFQFPFVCVGVYAFFRGAERCKWIRLPAIVYGSHLTTILFAIAYHIFNYDFSKSPNPGPRTFQERVRLFCFYMPYLVIPFLIMMDAIFSPAYRSPEKVKKP